MEEMSKRNYFFSIKELKGSNTRSKPQRISALQPYFENGKIWLKEDMKDLIDQITRFPKIAHDDIIDALAYILEIMIPADADEKDKWEGSTLPENQRALWDHKDSLGSRKRVNFKKRYRF
jgi:hypothetical protein